MSKFAVTSGQPVLAARPQSAPVHGAGVPARGQLLLLPALVTAGLLYLCHFPVAFGWLAWVALVPLLSLVRSTARPRRIYFCAWLGGLAFYFPVLQWLRVADDRMYFSWIFLALYCAAYWPLALYLIRLVGRRTRLPLVLIVPVVWTALEYLRSTFGTGFSWYLLAHTQHDFLPLIQISDLTGAWGVSFLVVAVNALLFEVLVSRAGARSLFRLPEGTSCPTRLGLLKQAAVLGTVLLATLGYGLWRLNQDTQRPGARVALVQGNIPQQIRNMGFDPSDPDQREQATVRIGRDYCELADLGVSYAPDLVVWPETSYPAEWPAVSPEVPWNKVPAEWRARHREGLEFAQDVAVRWPTASLLGLNTRFLEPGTQGQRYNTALLIDSRGQVAGMYHKSHRVPFGEYVPLVDWFPWMKRLAPYDFDYAIGQGKEFTRLPLRVAGRETPGTFGVMICYEDTDPDTARPYGGGDGKPPADFVLDISNDGWFDGTAEHEEHLAICRFRAVELRRSVARAVNMGISAVIDSNGRVLQPRRVPSPYQFGLFAVNVLGGSVTGLPWLGLGIGAAPGPKVWAIPVEPAEAKELPPSQWRDYKKVSGVLLASMPEDDRPALYPHWGDWLPRGCWVALAVCVAFRRWRRPDPLSR